MTNGGTVRGPLAWLVTAAIMLCAPALVRAQEVSLETTLRITDGRTVEVELTNAGSQAVTLLTRDTPFDRLMLGPSLWLEMAGESDLPETWIHYRGRQAKRLPPGPDELLQIAPQQSVSATVVLEQGWHVPASGNYRIGLAHGWRVAHDSPARLVSRSRQLQQRLDASFTTLAPVEPVEAGLFAGSLLSELQPRLRAPAFANCSAAQERQITLAADTAERLATQSVSDVRELSVDEAATSPRLNTWFGAYDEARYGNVLEDLDSIASALSDQQIGFNCDCDDQGVFAFVYANQAYDIYLCPAFWAASLEGTDSRAGTIVHELSHFRVVAGTDDHVYTQARAQNLASSNPNLAIDNADTFEYFVENTPPLELRGNGSRPVDDDSASDGAGASFVDSGFLSRGTVIDYPISSGDAVNVESLTGDADLIVYEGDLAISPAAVCIAEALPSVSVVDSCALEGSGPWVARVLAYTDTDYRISINGQLRQPADDDVSVADSGSIPDTGSIPDSGGSSGSGAFGPLALIAVAGLWWRRRLAAGAVSAPRALTGLAVVGALLGGCAVAADKQGAGVDVRLAPAGQASSTEVQVEMHNAGLEPVEVLLWNTPFETPLSADLFDVSTDGRSAPYVGRMVKRGTPPPDAWLTLAPGERVQTVIDLAAHYELDAAQRYDVALRVPVIDGVSGFNESTAVRVVSEPVSLTL